MALQIETLGEFRVLRDGVLVSDREWKSQKNRQLVKILITYLGHALTKEQLMDWIWPDADPDSAGRNLRVSISQTRKALEPSLERGSRSQFIITTDSGYVWNSSAPQKLDIVCFLNATNELLQGACPEDLDSQISLAEEIKALYRGPYLEEDRYEDWVVSRREEVYEAHLSLLGALAEWHSDQGRYQRAISLCREILSQDRVHERTVRQYMLYNYLAGNSSEAIRAFERFAHELAAELSVQPGDQTHELLNQIKSNNVPGTSVLHVEPLTLKEIPYSLSPSSFPLVGRTRQLQRLRESYDEAHSGTARLLFIGGEAGAGKTRLAREFLRLIEAESILSAEATSHPLDLNLSYLPWSKIADQLVSTIDPQILASLEPKWLAEVLRISPRLASRFPELEPNPNLERERQFARCHSGVEHFLAHIAERSDRPTPLVIYFDDIQWWDDDSHALLAHLAARLQKSPVWMLCAYRSEEFSPYQQYELLAQADNVDVLEVTRLSASETRELIQNLPLDEKTLETLYGRIYTETTGNPLFVISSLQNLFELGHISIKDHKWAISASYASRVADNAIPIPITIQETISLRLKRLEEAERKLLRIAAVLGRDWDFSMLEALWDNEEPCLPVLLKLLDLQLITEQEQRFGFSHPKIMEVVLSETSPAIHQLINQRVLHVLESTHVGALDLVSSTLAQYAFAGGLWDKAAEYALLAVRRTHKFYLLQETVKLAELGIEACSRLSTTRTENAASMELELLSYRAKAYDFLGEREKQLSDLNRRLEICNEFGNSAEAAVTLCNLGELHNLINKFDSAIDYLDQAESAYSLMNNRMGTADVLTARSESLHRTGHPQLALKALEEAVAIYEESGSLQGLAESLMGMGNLQFFSLAHYENARRNFERALDLFEKVGDLPRQARALNNLGNVYYFALLKYNEAIDYYQQALEIFQALGERYGEGMVQNNIGNVYKNIHLGKIEEAPAYLWRSIVACEEVGDRVGEVISYSVLGEIEATLGRYERSIEIANKALAICDEIDLPGERLGLLYNIGLSYLQLEQYEHATRTILKALEIAQQIEDERGLGFCPSALGEIYRREGRYEDALEKCLEALAVEERLKIDDELVDTLSCMGLIYLGMGQSEYALDCSERAVSILEGLENFSAAYEIYFAHAKILYGLGESELASQYLNRAHEELQHLAKTITDNETQRSFLQNVPINREIVEAWTALS